jgi:hypothetical protein
VQWEREDGGGRTDCPGPRAARSQGVNDLGISEAWGKWRGQAVARGAGQAVVAERAVWRMEEALTRGLALGDGQPHWATRIPCRLQEGVSPDGFSFPSVLCYVDRALETGEGGSLGSLPPRLEMIVAETRGGLCDRERFQRGPAGGGCCLYFWLQHLSGPWGCPLK